jgi:hypothetical protein
MNLLGCLTIAVIIAKKRICSSMWLSGIGDPPEGALSGKFLSGWRRTQKRLEPHLRLMFPIRSSKRLEESIRPADERHGRHE